MSTNYTTNVNLAKPARADRNWDVQLNANADALDACAAVGSLAAAATEVPSASLNVKVAAGQFRKSDGTVVSFGGNASLAIAPNATTSIWLTETGILATGSAFPAATNVVRVATVTAGASTVATISDQRTPWFSFGMQIVGVGNQNANLVSAGPPSGGPAAPSYRVLVGADLPVFAASGTGHNVGAVPDPGAAAGAVRYLREDASWAVPPGGGGGGAVSVALALPSQFVVSGSPVTGSGTLSAGWTSQGVNQVFAGPATGSGTGAPAFRPLTGADLPAFGASGASHAPGAVPDPGLSAGSTRFLREDGSWSAPVGGGGAGTVTSIGLNLPPLFVVTGSPVTTSGSLSAALASQSSNLVFASPIGGPAGTPAFRALVGADLPAFGASGASHAPGAVPDPGLSAGSTRFLREDGSWSAPVGGGGGGMAIGGTVTSGNQNSILYVGSTGLAQDSSNFNYSPINRALLVGTIASGQHNRLVVNSPTTADGNAACVIAAENFVGTNKALVLQGASGQSHQLFEVQDSLGNVLHQIDQNGSASVVRGVSYSWPSSQGVAATYLKNDGGGNLTWSAAAAGGGGGGSNVVAVTTPGAYPYTATAADSLILVDTVQPRTITLPSGATAGVGRVYLMKDANGSAYTNNVTVNVSGGGAIDGATSIVIATNYGEAEFVSDGTNWKRKGNRPEFVEGSLTVQRQMLVGGSLNLSSCSSTTQTFTLNPNFSINQVNYLGAGAGAVTANLPSAASIGSNMLLVVKDVAGTAGAHNIAITPNGADTIDGASAPVSISSNYGAAWLLCNSVNGWSTVSAAASGGGVGGGVAISLPAAVFTNPPGGNGSNSLTFVLNTQTTNTFLAGPASGGSTTPTFRAIASADVAAALATGVSAPFTFMDGGGNAVASVDGAGGIHSNMLFGASTRYWLKLQRNVGGAALYGIGIAEDAGGNVVAVDLSNNEILYTFPEGIPHARYMMVPDANGRASCGIPGSLYYAVNAKFHVRATETTIPALIAQAAYLPSVPSFQSQDWAGTWRVAVDPSFNLVFGDQSSTTQRQQGSIQGTWATSTDATRKGRLAGFAADFNADREGWRVEGDGTQALVGFFGASAVARPNVTGSKGSNSALAALITALANLGLVTDSTT